MKKEILIIVATHGQEKIGVEVIKNLKAKGLEECFDYLIANPKALEAGKEFIDVNLNRIYPGKKISLFYEERLAYKNLKIAKKYRYIIDLHEASQSQDDFIIVPREQTSRKFPLERINLGKVLLWPEPKGSLAGVLENAIELEFGSKNRKRKEMIEKATNILGGFFLGKTFLKKEVFYVYGKLLQENFKGDITSLCDFEEIKIGKEKFFPLLTGQYLREGIVCYKMKKILI
jgi:succinylglutamate desuccinylase